MRGDFRGRALRHDAAAMDARAGTQVHDVIGLTDRILIVLDHDDGVAEIAQVDQGVEQALVVALVQADRGLVENVHDADQPRADLAREPNALRLAAGESIGAAIQGEVAQADIAEKSQPIADFLDDLDGDFAAPAEQFELAEEFQGALHRQRRHFGNAFAVDEDISRGAIEPGSPALGAGARGAILGQLLAHCRRFGFLVAALQISDDAFEGVLALDRAALAVEVLELDLFIVAAEQHQILDLLRQAFEGRLDVELGVPRQRLDQLEIVGVAPIPAAHRAAGERQMRIGDDFRRIEEILGAEAVAGRACADRAVEGEQARLEFAQGIVADGAGELVWRTRVRRARGSSM